MSDLGVPVEVRNQARVHLQYPDRFGMTYPPLKCAAEGIDRFLAVATQIGIRRAQEGYEIYAPHGLDDFSALTIRPNLCANFSARFYGAKAAAWKALWPELTVLPAE